MLVFVYGTLRRGEANHRLLVDGRAEYLGEAQTARRYTLVDLGAFPALIATGETTVAGEVYRVDGPTLEALDRLEGHPRFYTRRHVQLAGWRRGGEEVWSYFLPNEEYGHQPVIASGNWRKRGRGAIGGQRR